jgi:hypothetical protein
MRLIILFQYLSILLPQFIILLFGITIPNNYFVVIAPLFHLLLEIPRDNIYYNIFGKII